MMTMVGDLSCPSWEDRLSELADYRKIHGHCNVPQQLKKHQVGYGSEQGSTGCTEKESIVYIHLPNPGIGSLDFEWDNLSAVWEDRLSELADYRKIHGTAMFLTSTAKNNPIWEVGQTQGSQVARRKDVVYDPPSEFRNWKAWVSNGTATAPPGRPFERACRLSQIHGHCNVPQATAENSKLLNWVRTQRKQYSCTKKERHRL
jgi:hypothetical protein